MISKALRSIEKLLKKVYNFIASGPSKEHYITDSSSFSRNRILTFPVVVSTILNLFKESVEYNLSLILPFFNTTSSVTGAAFSLARFKIHISFFADLNKILVDFHHNTHTKLWKGFRLLAADGSTVSLPASKQMKNHFGVHSSNNDGVKNCLAQALMIFDVFTDFVIAGRLSKMENSERTLLNESLETLPQFKSILLLDRGFGDFSTLKRLLKYKKDFCVRISGSSSLFGQRTIEMVETDVITDWHPSKKEKETCCKHNLDYEPIKVRVTKVTLANGEVELLVSSLCNLNLYSNKDIATLYELRWGIEEGYKKLKPKMKLEHFGSRKPEGIFQEFEAHIFMINLISIIGRASQYAIDCKHKHRGLKYKFNWQNAYRFIRHKIISLVNFYEVKKLVDELITLIIKSVIAIRPNRSFPRSPLRKNKTRLHQTYK